MEQTLYIGGFQEQDNKKSPRTQISKRCEENGNRFYECDIPGDTSKGEDIDTVFSMSTWKNSIKEKIISILDNSEEDLDIYAYSLAARPTIDAISEIGKEYQERVALFLIHPAYNPLHAIKVLDWYKTNEFDDLESDDYYLNPNKKGTFDNLISGRNDYRDWIGDEKQFRKDLQDYYDRGVFTWEEFQEHVNKLPYDAQIIGDKIESDRVIHNLHDIQYSKEKRGEERVVMSHLVKLAA